MALTKIKTTGLADGTDGQIITYDASGSPTAVGPGSDGQVLTSTGAGSPPAFEAAAAPVGGANGIDFNDSIKTRYGTDNDLELYHNGTNTIIKDNTGFITLNGKNGLAFHFDGATKIEFSDGNNLYHNGQHDRLVGADASNGGKIVFYDDNSHLSHYTTLQGGNAMSANWNLTLPTAAPSANGQALTATTAGQASWTTISSDLVDDTSPQLGGDLDTNSFEISLDDSHKVKFGDSDDLAIWHDGTDSYIQNDTGNLFIRGDGDDIFLKAVNTEDSLICKPNAAVEIFYDGTKKFETTSAGATVTGNLEVTGTLPSMDDSDHYTGSHICLGTDAGKYTGSNYKICIGYQAGQYGTGRHNNTFIGVNAGRGNSDGTSSTGDSNCCIGDYAGEDLTSGSSNTLIGPNAGKDVTSGNSNVIVGKSAGSTANDIHGTVIIGPSSGYGLDESNYSVIIGHGASGETLQGDAADNQLFIARQGYGGGSDGTWIYGNSSGQCQQGGGSSSWYTGSDERYKDFLGKYSRGLAEINALDVQNFKWKDKDKMPDIAFNNSGSYCGPTIDGKTKIGIGAQSCEKVIPEAVNKLEPCELEKGGNHMLTLDNDPIFWAMVNAIQELSAKVTALENA